MPSCDICDRAMVVDSWLPLNICRRAGCEPEREFLICDMGRIYQTFDWIAQGARVSGSGINRA